MGSIFYVYEHWRPDTSVCFYVGKGKGMRATQIKTARNKHHRHITEKLAQLGMCVEVRLFASDLAESEAFLIEIERIAFWRGAGVRLVNLTNGGEGPSGYQQSLEHRRKNSIAGRAYRQTPEGRAAFEKMLAAALVANTGRPLGVETKLKMSKTRKGHPLTREQLSFIERAKNKTPEHIAAVRAAKAKARAARAALESPDDRLRREETRYARRSKTAAERYIFNKMAAE